VTRAAEVSVTDLRYPIGPFSYDGRMTDARRAACIARIAAAPGRLRAAVTGLDDGQLDTPYRPGGWTVRQVVHHVPDSHLNAYTRIRLALTEDTPTIKPYEEARWAELPDARTLPVEISRRPALPPPRAREDHDGGRAAGALRLAWRPSHGARHHPPRPHGMALSSPRAVTGISSSIRRPVRRITPY
jgi:hypothetical protein